MGKRFGNLVVVGDAPQNELGRFCALCKCDCGIVREFNASSLKSGKSQSCGCLFRELREDVIGNKYGRVTVIKDAEHRGDARYVLGKCECGDKLKEYCLCSLKSGAVKSCGCYSRERIKETHTNSKKDWELKHPLFGKIEEIRDKISEPGIEVKCKKCNKWFPPTANQIWARIRAIKNPTGFEENNLYCSDECKHSCILYNLCSDPFKDTTKPFTQTELNIFAEEVKSRQRREFGYNFCEYKDCENEGPYHAHHERPKSAEWIFALDPDNGIVFCSEHHYSIGHRGECNMRALADKCKDNKVNNE